MRRLVMILTAILSLMLFAGVASAHVTVWPKQSPAGGYERYTVRVPVEKAVSTTKVRVELPAGSTYSGFLPVPGWTVTPEKNASGKVIAVTWSGGEIKPGEFQEFGLSVKNPPDAADVAWKAYQTYSDNSVVEWTGDAKAATPAPMVKLAPAAAAGDEHGATTPAAPTQPTTPAAPQTPAAPATAGTSSAGTWLGGGALLLSAIALVMALRKR